MYSAIDEMPPEGAQRVTDVTYLGVLYGTNRRCGERNRERQFSRKFSSASSALIRSRQMA